MRPLRGQDETNTIEKTSCRVHQMRQQAQWQQRSQGARADLALFSTTNGRKLER
jgi:hypothetical protein